MENRPVPEGQLAGRVVDAAGQPVFGVMLKVSSAETAAQASSSPDGAFVFEHVPEGRYVLSASLDGYLTTEYGAFQPGDPGVPVRAIAGKRVTNLDLTLRKGGAISGRIVDDRGDPLTGHVSILLPDPQGLRTIVAASTDVNGGYRFGDLPSGTYAVLAVPDSSPREFRVKDANNIDRPAARVPTFFPAAATFAGASLVTAGPDSDAGGINVQVQTVPATTVEITITSAGGRPLDRAQAVLIADDERGPAKMLWANDPDADSTAHIPSVTAGQYRLIVTALEQSPPDPNGPPRTLDQLRLQQIENLQHGPEWAVRQVSVDGVTPQKIPIVLDRGAVLEIRTTLEAEGLPAGPASATSSSSGRPAVIVSGRTGPGSAATTGARLTLVPFGGGLPQVLAPAPYVLSMPSSATGTATTTIPGVLPGRYLLKVTSPPSPSRYVKSAEAEGADVLNQPIELVAGQTTTVTMAMSDRQTEVAGTVTAADGTPRTDAAVVIFPKDTRYWISGTSRIAVTRPDTLGEFVARGLPAGDYLLALVTMRPPEDQADAQWLNSLQPGAIPIKLADGQRLLQNLRTGR